MSSTNLMIISATIIAFILPVLVQFLKAKLGIESGKVKTVLAFGMSVSVGTIIACATKQIIFADLISFANAESMLVAHSVVYSVSQLFYLTYLKPKLKVKELIKVGLTD